MPIEGPRQETPGPSSGGNDPDSHWEHYRTASSATSCAEGQPHGHTSQVTVTRPQGQHGSTSREKLQCSPRPHGYKQSWHLRLIWLHRPEHRAIMGGTSGSKQGWEAPWRRGLWKRAVTYK